jgi:hypothetical protein
LITSQKSVEYLSGSPGTARIIFGKQIRIDQEIGDFIKCSAFWPKGSSDFNIAVTIFLPTIFGYAQIDVSSAVSKQPATFQKMQLLRCTFTACKQRVFKIVFGDSSGITAFFNAGQ